jgi:3,2-trans-enoyl-CoA isomerase
MTLGITDHDSGIRVIRLQRPPVNALDPDLVSALNEALDNAVADGVNAIVIAGGPKVFSAGLDVPTLLGLDREAMGRFWAGFIGIAARLARSPVPVVAAIDGHSPAGGAVVALFCDMRIMARSPDPAKPFLIGLNEVQVGLPVPPVIQSALRRQVGPRAAERLLVAGTMVDSDTALAMGFVDSVCESGQAEAQALTWCQQHLALPRQAMLATRREARADIAALFNDDDRSVDAMTDAWFSEETQTTMKALVARLLAGRS